MPRSECSHLIILIDQLVGLDQVVSPTDRFQGVAQLLEYGLDASLKT